MPERVPAGFKRVLELVGKVCRQRFIIGWPRHLDRSRLEASPPLAFA